MNTKESASNIISSIALKYLETQAQQNNGLYEFDRSELVTHLNEVWPDQRNTPGAQNGGLNRLFDASEQIEKIAHGRYVYRVTANLSHSRIIGELKKCYAAIDNLTVDLSIVGSFTSEDRRLIYDAQRTLDELEKLMQSLES